MTTSDAAAAEAVIDGDTIKSARTEWENSRRQLETEVSEVENKRDAEYKEQKKNNERRASTLLGPAGGMKAAQTVVSQQRRVSMLGGPAMPVAGSARSMASGMP